jgi:hypothetical protein
MRWLVAAIWLTGCTGNVQKPPPQPLLELGDVNGDPYADGQDVTLVAGAQGGFHIWLDWHVFGMPSEQLVLERTAHRVSDDQLVLRTSTTLELDAPDENGWSWAPMPVPMFMCPAPVGLNILDEPIELELRFSARDGTGLTSQSVTVVPHCPDEARDFCQRICSG